MVAPGTLLRDGLDRILRAKRGALVIVGDGHEVLSICSGGFLLDSEFSPQRLSELAKMDGAIILAKDSSRIARANVHLMPDPSIPTTETGTRHRTAERVARSIDVPVLSVSAAMSIIAVYRNNDKHIVQPTGWLHDRTDQALATMQRFRNRFDVAVNGLSILEVEDSVSVGDVVGVVQAAEMVLRIAEEVDGYLVELGEDGRLVGLQSAELVDGVAPALHLVVRDYCAGESASESHVPSSNSHGDASGTASSVPRSTSSDRLALVNKIVDELSELPSDELSDPKRVAEVLRLPGTFDDAHSGIEPRGYRLLYRLPRFSDAIIERIVDRFHNLQQIMRASLSELEKVEGVGEARAHSVKNGLARLAEASIFERYQ
jgi:diadenylate cyclase